MNIEEAKANIGAEVVLLEDTKPYRNDAGVYLEKHVYFYETNALFISEVDKDIVSVLIKNQNHRQIGTASFYAKHIALKEPKMQNYKIKFANEAESKEAQELFFELGYGWLGEKHNTPLYTESQYLYGFANADLGYGSDDMVFRSEENQEITLPQLRDLVVLHRNDVGDATHGAHFSYDRFYISDNCTKEYIDGKWVDKESHAMPIPLSEIKEPFVQVVGRGNNQMTWQDALRAMADGKEVEMIGIINEWADIKEFNMCRIMGASEFRLAPQRKELNGNYTKEELLKIVGEMG